MSQQPNQDVPEQSQPPFLAGLPKPFRLREYVAACREKNFRNNWPFGDEYLDVLLKNGANVKDLLPPLLPIKTPHADKFNNAERSKNDDVHKEDASGVAKKVPNEEGNQHNSVTSANFSQSGDTCTVASSNRVAVVQNQNKRIRRRKGISKRHPLVNTLAAAPLCTEEDAQSTNQLPVKEEKVSELDDIDEVSCASCN